MSILTKKVKLKRHPSNIKYYDVLVKKEQIILQDGFYSIPIKFLKENSSVIVQRKCDICGDIQKGNYNRFMKCSKKWEGKHLCQKCTCIQPNKIRKQQKTFKKNFNGNSNKTIENKRKGQLGRKHSQESKIKRSISIKKTISDPIYKEQIRKKNPRNLDDFIKKYGKDIGYQKYKNKILDKSPRRPEYWIIKGHNTQDAIQLVSQFQNRNLNYWTNKYGEKKGEKKYLEWRYKIAKNSTPRYSKESYDFFNIILQKFKLNIKECYFGPEEKFISLFKEERKILNKNLIWVDFKYKNIIIEYNGQYWHQDPEQDKKRIDILNKRGFKAMSVHSLELKENPFKIFKDLEEIFNES